MIDQQRQIRQQQAVLDQQAATDRPATAIWFVAQNVIQPFTTGGVKFMAGLPRAVVYPRRWRLTLYVATTNNATNYWTINLRNSGGAAGIIAATTTAALAADAWYTVDVDLTSVVSLSVAADKMVDISLSRSGAGGAPGALQLHPVLLVL